MTAFPTYSTGTVTIAADATSVVGTGADWSGTNAVPGDLLVVDGHTVVVRDVTDGTHLAIDAWPFTALTSATAYVIYQSSIDRYDPVQNAKDVRALVNALNTNGFFVFVGSTETVPDPSLGEDGQFALQPSTGKRWHKEGGQWILDGTADALFSRYDLASFDTDRPASGELIVKIFLDGVTFRAGLTDSRAGAEVAATADAVFSITKNGTEFATLTFAASSATGTFACVADTTFALGDVLRVIAPNPRDATLSGVAATFIGYR